MSKEAEDFIVAETWRSATLKIWYKNTPKPQREVLFAKMQAYADLKVKEELEELLEDCKALHPEYILEKIEESIEHLKTK